MKDILIKEIIRRGMVMANCNESKTIRIEIYEFNFFVEFSEKAINIGINNSASLIITIGLESFFLR